MARAAHLVLVSLLAAGQSQLLQPGTIDVPIPRPGDCNSEGPATYVYRASEKEPNDYFPNVCAGLGGATVRFNDPCAWARGQGQMTVAHFTNMCKGAGRTVHWHNTADEWGFVNKGRLETFVASADGLPWPSSHNIISKNGVWYFPSGTLHGLLCHTSEEEGGCEFTIVFASPQAAEPNGHNLDTTFAQAPNDVAAAVLGISTSNFAALRPAFARAEHSIHYSNVNMTSPIVTVVAPGICEPECPRVTETVAAPAAIETANIEQTDASYSSSGVVFHRIRTAQFPFARTMSQERTELSPGAVRPMVWTSADAILVVIHGSITYGLEGGIPGSESKTVFPYETLGPGDVAYIPNARAYWFREASGKASAMTITVFNVGDWKNFEMSQQVAEMNQVGVKSSIHVTHLQQRVGATDLSADYYRRGLLRATGQRMDSEVSMLGMSRLASMLMAGLAVWALLLTIVVVFLVRKVQSRGSWGASPLLA